MTNGLGVVLTAALLSACSPAGPTEPIRTWPPDALLVVSVRLGTEKAAIVRESGRLGLVIGPEHGPVTLRTSYPDRPGIATVYLTSAGGTSPGPYPTFVFGNLPPGATNVQFNLPGSLAGVAGGVFLVAAPVADVSPNALGWSFLSPSGQVVLAGSGIRN